MGQRRKTKCVLEIILKLMKIEAQSINILWMPLKSEGHSEPRIPILEKKKKGLKSMTLHFTVRNQEKNHNYNPP